MNIGEELLLEKNTDGHLHTWQISNKKTYMEIYVDGKGPVRIPADASTYAQKIAEKISDGWTQVGAQGQEEQAEHIKPKEDITKDIKMEAQEFDF